MSIQDVTADGGRATSEDGSAVPLEEALRPAEEKRAARMLARARADGLRALAGLIESNPDLMSQFGMHALRMINVPVGFSGDAAEQLAAVVRAGMAAGAEIEKKFDGDFAGAVVRWGPIGLHVYADRTEVCERVVTGTETVTRSVPDPEALAAVPLVEVSEQVELVEWVCRPLMAAGSQSAEGGV